MKIFLLLYLLTVAVQGFSQTKLIAHRSHGGSDKNFRNAFEKSLFDVGESNFGLVQKSLSRLDSVIFVSEAKIIVITRNFYYTSDSAKKKAIDDPKLWTINRMVYTKHPLFSKHRSIDSIKKVLDQKKNYLNDSKTVVFMGYEQKKIRNK